MTTPSESAVLDGMLQTRDAGHQVISFDRRLEHPVAAVWPQLVRPELLAGWLAAADPLEPAEGGAVVLSWLNTDSVATGTVSAFDPPTLVEYDTDLHGRIRFELQDEGGGTALAFSATLPAPIGEPASLLAGWHLHLDFLEQALRGRAVDWPHWDAEGRWQRLHDAYAAQWGG